MFSTVVKRFCCHDTSTMSEMPISVCPDCVNFFKIQLLDALRSAFVSSSNLTTKRRRSAVYMAAYCELEGLFGLFIEKTNLIGYDALSCMIHTLSLFFDDCRFFAIYVSLFPRAFLNHHFLKLFGLSLIHI